MLSHVFLGVLFLCAVATAIQCTNSDDMEYGIMIDAGSSGTRMHFFTWPSRELVLSSFSQQVSQIPLVLSLSELAPTKLPASSFVTRRGLGTFGADAAGAVNSLNPMLVAALDEFADCKDKMKTTGIYLKATAGMRVIPQTQATDIISAIRTRFATSGFAFRQSNVEIIAGDEEGMYGWMSAQYLTKRLPDVLGTDGAPVSYGAMDLGGASTQISFQSPQPILNNVIAVRLGLVSERLYAASYLYYGNDEALRGIVALQQQQGPAGLFPCFFKGDVHDVKLNNGQLVTLNGTSNFTACQELVVRYLRLTTPCDYEQCAINGHYQPPIPANQIFYAVSAFFHAVDNIGGLRPDATLNEITTKATQVCALTYSQAQAQYNSAPYLSEYCWQAVYVVTLLSRAYGFPMDQRAFRFVSDINGTSVDWTTGAMLEASNLLSFEVSQGGMRSGTWVTLLTVAIVVTAALTAGICRACFTRVVQNDGYVQLH
eukprot:gnl/Spiro4/404_TR220_c0_g1_i1.p1 gnl/Spiro4/404_TR220_c0_g1~~gnl/Spiro4/404_TR220_c0_g1_i1.p1  ORF type:complete len:485 (+),score=209.99 gnl/Spiro4/404_TR220_c0_g1_i1:38-1492(+)